MNRKISVTVTVVVLLILIILGSALTWEKSTGGLAIYDGVVSVDSADAQIRIVRDQYAIPHIFSSSELDSYFGLGFVHAQDRYWQMLKTRNLLEGRLTELFGPDALENDIIFRTYGISRTANEAYAELAESDRERIDAYADGVNAWLDSELYRTPPEMLLLGLDPEKWTARDSLVLDIGATAIFMWLALLEEWEAGNHEIDLGTEGAHEVLHGYPADGHVSLSVSDIEKTMGNTFSHDQWRSQSLGEWTATTDITALHQSNNWVISGEHTASGSSMLAGDPHLPLALPNRYHLARISYPGHDVAGAFTAGAPGAHIGRTRNLAFTVTVNVRDNYDINVLRLNPDDPSQYYTEDGYQEFTSRVESFHLNNGEVESREYLSSHHGPIIPVNLIDPLPKYGDGVVLALSWAPTYSSKKSLAVLHSNRASTIEEWMEATASQSLTLDRNVVVAHRSGDIGILVAGAQAHRRVDHETGGRTPSDGSKRQNKWLGIYPQEFLPRVINPESGIIVTANAKVIPDEFPVPGQYYYAPPSRQQRIKDMLEAQSEHTFDSFRNIQLDSRNIEVLRILPALLATQAQNAESVEALNTLAHWNGDWRANSAAPIIYLIWYRALARSIAQDELGSDPTKLVLLSEVFFEKVLSLGSNSWCDNTTTDVRVESCGDILSGSLKEAMEVVTDHYGSDWSSLRLYELLEHRITHEVLENVPLLKYLSSRSMSPADGIGVPSGAGAPNVGYIDFKQLPDFRSKMDTAPAMRFIIDWADPDAAGFITAGGQSGHFLSPHYDDLLNIWKQGKYIKIPFSEEAITASHELLLEPRDD